MNKPLTIITIGDSQYIPTKEDLKRWQIIFEQGTTLDETIKKYPHMANQKTQISSVVEMEPDYNRVLLVKVGNKNDPPTKEDLEAIRDCFEMAVDDKDFKIFTHLPITVEEIKFDDNETIIVE
jgi:hypothetical protein